MNGTDKTMTEEQLKNGAHVVHVKHNKHYRIVECSARMKDSVKGWIDCIIYAPLYENEYSMFCRERTSFLNEFQYEHSRQS